MAQPLFEIEKNTTHGSSFALRVGPAGHPSTVEVPGLSHDQAERLGHALMRLQERAQYQALEAVRSALGISQR